MSNDKEYIIMPMKEYNHLCQNVWLLFLLHILLLQDTGIITEYIKYIKIIESFEIYQTLSPSTFATFAR